MPDVDIVLFKTDDRNLVKMYMTLLATVVATVLIDLALDLYSLGPSNILNSVRLLNLCSSSVHQTPFAQRLRITDSP